MLIIQPNWVEIKIFMCYFIKNSRKKGINHEKSTDRILEVDAYHPPL